jgi:phosphonate transport system substrate-binding protein
MIVGKTSAGGYLSQKLSLKEQGLDVDHDCELSIAADNHQENVIISVSIGDADAGFIRESALHKADEFIMPGSIVSIGETAWLPNWALSVDRNLPDAVKNKIQKSVLKLPRDSKILKAMGLVSFIAATDADYDIMRSIVK